MAAAWTPEDLRRIWKEGALPPSKVTFAYRAAERRALAMPPIANLSTLSIETERGSILFETIDPQSVVPEWDQFGLAAVDRTA